MGLWFPRAGLAADENVRYQALGNTFQGRRIVGVRVLVTDRRLVVVPNHLDRVTGGRRRDLLLTNIRAVHIAEPGIRAVKRRGFGAAIRPQIEISVQGAPDLILTVVDPDGLIGMLSP